MARSLQERLGINANVGDTIRMSFALTNQNGEYDLVVPTSEVIATKPQEVDILGEPFMLSGGEVKTVGTDGNGIITMRNGTLFFEGGSVPLDKARIDLVQGQEILKEFKGGYQGNAAGLKLLLHKLHLFDMIRNDTEAWRKISNLADEGRMIKIDYEDGALKISSEGKVLYERTGATVSKESVDRLSQYQYGREVQHIDKETFDYGSGLVNAESALRIISSGNVKYYVPIVRQMLTDEGAENVNLVKLSEGLDKLLQRKGIETGYSNVEGKAEGGLKINLGFIEAGVGGSLAEGFKSADTREISLNQLFTRTARRKAYKDTIKEFGGRGYDQLTTQEERERFIQSYAQHFAHYMKEISDFYESNLDKKTVYDYGATKVGKVIFEKAVKSISWLKDEVKEVADEVAKTKKEIDESWKVA